jgi:hypothetical protein
MQKNQEIKPRHLTEQKASSIHFSLSETVPLISNSMLPAHQLPGFSSGLLHRKFPHQITVRIPAILGAGIAQSI